MIDEPSPPALSAEEAAKLFRHVLRADEATCLLAVSGGADSTALMRLAAEAAPLTPPVRFVVASVDHGLREAAGAEAEGVASRARALGMEAHLLRWRPAARPERGVQKAARIARYALLAGCAQACGARVVMTAHTLDDQAETVLMRLAAGSGIDGLAAMSSRAPLGDVVLARPFLQVPKSRLVATCLARGWDFVEDPSNRNAAFARPRLRAAAASLAAEGLTPERLARLARRAASARDALDACARRRFESALRARDENGLAFAAPIMLAEPFEIALRAVACAIDDDGYGADAVRDVGYGPRLGKLEALCEALIAAQEAGAPMPGRTLAGMRVSLDERGVLRVSRAPPRRAG